MAKVKSFVETKVNIQTSAFGNYISQMLYEEYQLGDTFDMVIKSGSEKHELYCHKIVLAASSEFLSKLLQQQDSASILLPDIATDIVEYVLLFIYTGEIKVPNDKYKEFMEACKLLEIKGLTFSSDELPESETVNCEPNINSETQVNVVQIESDYEELEELIPDDEDESQEDVPNNSNNQHYATKSNESSKVRLKYGFVLQPQTFRINGFETTSINKTIINKRKLPVALREPQTKISLDETNARYIREKLIYSVQNAFKDVQIPIDCNFNGNHKVQLVVKNSKLIKGQYNCMLCDKVMSIVYSVDKNGKFRQWVNSNLKRHIARVHDFTKQ